MVVAVVSVVGTPPRQSAAAEAFSLSLTAPITGLPAPVYIANAGDGSGRVFVVQQTGTIQIIQNGVVQNSAFLDIRSRISCCGERGLLSVAFPPDYIHKQHFYVYYTNLVGDLVIARYGLTADPDVADLNSEFVVLTIPHPNQANHNGGQLAFGPADGYLYIGTGDGGGGGDIENNAQNPGSLLGKILRIDVESEAMPYGIPPSNPYVQTAGYRGEIWALGVRNPWRFSFDRATAELFIGDVGQGAYEEIDYQPAASSGGENYGWRIMEGSHCFNPSSCSSTGLVLPVAEYDHSAGNCSVSGGFVYRGTQFTVMQGVYFYADFCSGRIWGLRRSGPDWTSDLLYDAPFQITSFGEDEAGNLYVTDYNNGIIYMLSAGPPATPTDTPTYAPTQTATATVPQGLAVSGEVRYAGSAQPVARATVQLQGAGSLSAQTDSTGQYALSDVPGGNWQLQPQKQGDIGTAISALDAVYVLQASVGLRTLNPEQRVACDVSGNGAITAFDAVLILQYQVGLIGKFPAAETCGSDWSFMPAPAAIPNQQTLSPQVAGGVCQNGSIAFQPLAASASGQNFAATVFGDCTGNWQPSNASAVFSNIGHQERAAVRLGRSVRRGTQLLVPVYVDSGAWSALDATLRYDPSLFTPVGLRHLRATRGALIQMHVRAPGTLALAVANAGPLPRGAAMVLRFATRDRGRTAPITIEHSRVSTTDGAD